MNVRVTLEPLSLSLRSPLATAHGEICAREGWRVRVDAGSCTGWGEALPLPDFGTETQLACERGLNAAAERLQVLPRVLPELDGALEGLESAPAARFALESALLDVMAQRHGMPVAQLLGGAAKLFPVNALVGGGDVASVSRQASDTRAAGFGTLKLKVAVGDDVARVFAAREATGPDVRLRIDANGGWSAEQAVQLLRQMAAAQLELCEQPTRDLDGLARVHAEVQTRIAADESLLQPNGPDEVLGRRACDVLVLKPMALGGLRRTVELAQRASAAGMQSYVTSLIDGEIARAAAAHVACAINGSLAHGLATGGLLADEPRTAWLLPHAGSLHVPSTPGLGVEVRA